ncbi:type II secretion system protein GspG [Candidatus Uabimicrobium sp. HlEnr_7]|uniref:type II secretion system protein GspG n=1 Tax=Candidatus Uabimicrobium helgolandensis TaxID=3095367 RepID=UPI0035580D11
MECNTIKDILDAYILGALEDEQNTKVKKHIHNCKECKKYHEVCVRSWQKLQDLPTVSPSVSYADRIIHRHRRGKRIVQWSISTIFIMVVLLLFVLFFLFFLFDYKKEYPQHHIANLEKVIWRFYSQNKKFPKQLRDIPRELFPQKIFKHDKNKEILDIWEIPYNYKNPGKYNKNFFDLYSSGKNKEDNLGYEDDIRNWK